MKKIKCSLAILVFITCLLISSVSYSALWEHYSYEEMIEMADIVVIGTIGGIVDQRVVNEREDFKMYATDWEINVASYLKGDGESVITVSTPGAHLESDIGYYTSADYSLLDMIRPIEEELSIKVEEVIFFLQEKDGSYHPITPNAIVPMELLNWEKYINLDEMDEEEIEWESLNELTYLKEYVEGGGDASNKGLWVAIIIGVISLVVIWGQARH